jgi:ribosomal protein L11 methyltransferase
MTPLHRLEIAVPAAALEAFEDAFADHVVAVSAEADPDAQLWRLSGYCDTLPDRDALQARLAAVARAFDIAAPEPRLDVIENTDWVTQNLMLFPPVGVGRFFIHGSHHNAPVPMGRIGIRIDAGQAFGTGAHGSTAGCLEALERVLKGAPPVRVLDVGCGSAILAIAAAKIVHRSVLACDIDPVAVAVAAENARLNGVPHLVETAVATGIPPWVRRRGPFDVVVANILARPLMDMAGDVAAALTPGGAVVLSGLLERERRRVEARYLAFGFRTQARLSRDGWATLILRKAG